MPRKHPHCLLNLIGKLTLLLATVALCGCQSLSPRSQWRRITGKDRAEKQRIAEYMQTQAEVVRFADVYSVMMAQAFDQLSESLNTPEGRAQTMQRKASQADAAVAIATGPSPIVNLMDMVVLVTLTRMAQEDYWVPKVYGDKGLPLLAILKSRETEVWKLAAERLSPDQVRQMHELIDDFRRKYPDQHYTAFLRFGEFATLLGKNVEAEKGKKGSILSLLYVDPLVNLTPATRQIEQTRYLAERAMFYFQRLPNLLQQHAQVAYLNMAASPEVQQALKMSEQWTGVIDQMPGLIPREREAAINQFFAGLANERTNLFDNLASQEPRTAALLTNLQSTLATGRQTAQAATELVKSSDELFQRYQASREKPRPTNQRPFDIRDYSQFMSETANTATQLNAMVVAGGHTLPKVQETGQALADHIFRLSLLFLVAIAVVAFVYRWLVFALFKTR